MPALSLRIDLSPDGRIGPGKIALLEHIAAEGSISAAARRMVMSYKHAWDLIEEMNALFGRPVLETQSGGKRGGGARLSPLGTLVVTSYREIEEAAHEAARPGIERLQSEIDQLGENAEKAVETSSLSD